MKDRLVQFLQLEQLSPARFADILGVQRSGISHILSGRNKPGFDLIEKILNKFPGISADWLITGKGKMYKETHTSPPLMPAEMLPHQQPVGITEKPAVHENTTQDSTLPLQPHTHIAEERSISKIIIFYTDKSFSEFRPE